MCGLGRAILVGWIGRVLYNWRWHHEGYVRLGRQILELPGQFLVRFGDLILEKLRVSNMENIVCSKHQDYNIWSRLQCFMIITCLKVRVASQFSAELRHVLYILDKSTKKSKIKVLVLLRKVLTVYNLSQLIGIASLTMFSTIE